MKKGCAVLYQKLICGELGTHFIHGPFTYDEAKTFLIERHFKPADRGTKWLRTEGESTLGIAEIIYFMAP